MASVDLEYNQGFKIYNANGTRFNNLVLHKATYETVVMSLGDKISGIVYYKNNKLVVNMTEYIMYKNVKYVLVNPPTVIKEGLVSDNGELKGMTKYSFTFYHPMYMLSNFPFSDIAVSTDQQRYLSQNKTFSWIGNLTDYVAKLNENLEGTQWKVSIGTNVTDAEKNKLSEVLSFDNNTIADALKTAYETWEIPYIIDQTYEGNKRFLVRFGLPNNEIYEKDKNGNFILDNNNQKIPFVFKYGQGVGLKNNSRTPKNNKIVTRIAGYGSEDNIPYGYPQIVWTGNQSWNYTINNDSTAANSYPIYDGIVGGQKVRLIKHPFTRTHLMPPIYSETVNKKVNPNATGYNPNTELVDYYDANDNTYPNQIKAGEQSYEIHEFEDIKPEFGSFSINSAAPYDGHSDESITQNRFLSIVDDLYTETDIKAEKTQLNALRTSFVTQQQNSSKGTSGNYEYDWSFKTDGQYKKVKYASSGANFEYVVNVGLTPATIDWDDTMDEQGNYVQSYFKVTIPALGFDLYASAAITQEMTINMRSGACIGCSFPVMVDWDDYKRNFYDKDGNFAPNGTQRNLTKYPNSTNSSITLILQKETNTFGTLMPNIYQQPKGESSEGAGDGDKFVILGISLPTSYITTAEGKLETEMKKYMRDNNVYYYEYPLKFDEHFLINNEHILSQMKPNVIVNFEYADVEQSLYIKQMSIKYNESPLPKYDITLTDDVDVVLNKIGEAIAEYRGQRQYENRGGNSETLDGNKFLRKDINDTASGTIRMLKGLQVGERFVTGLLGEGGIFRKDDDGTTYLECDRMYVRMKAYFDTVEVRRFIHSGGNRVASAAGIKCSRVEYYTQNNLTTNDASEAAYFRCYFRANDNGTEITNDFEINDLAYCKETNKVGEQANTTNAVATRSVSSNRSVSEENITISLVITNNTNTSVTLDGEARLVLSNPDVDGTYHGWNGSYNRTDRIVFSNSAVTLAVGESRTVTISGELYRRSPAGDNALAEAGSRSNVILYVGGVSEVVLCSKLSSSIVFQNGGTYNVSLSQGGQGISQRFYWRKVIGVSSAVTLDGEHYIDLSATDCATGSDVPIAQDDIIQLGNTIDAKRQGAIIEFVSGEDAPSYQIYQGINTYNLDNKNYIGLGYSSQTGRAYMNVYGDFLFGDKAESTYIKYMQEDEETGEPRLKIKAEVEFIHSDGHGGTESTTMDDFIDAIKQSIDDIQDQIDGSIDTWYYKGVPTLLNLPASEWNTDELKREHIGDLYYDKESGNAYRFIYDTTVEPNEYKWIQLHDDAISEALRLASEAKDTADNKRRVFLTQPTPPYDQGDLWVNAVWPTSGEHQGETYNNEILKCVTAKTSQQAFSISDWSVANGYTAALNDFLTNTYAPFISNIQGQVDQKAETWYQDSNPATAWYDATQTPVYDVRAKHVGDIWMDTSANGGKQTYIYQYNTSTANYEWKAQAVPNEVFDYADGKCAIYVNNPTNAQNPYPTNYHEKDMWILPIDGTHNTYTIGGVEFKAGEVLFSSTDSTSFDAAHWSKKLRYTGDERIDGFINQILNGTGASGDDATVANAISSIKGALNEGTLIDGGLVLTSVLGLRSNSRVWAGISGMYNTSETGTGYKGHGIAAWYGGGMADWEVYLGTLSPSQQSQAEITDAYAKSLFRFDGSGYVASGNVSWDKNGVVTIKNLTSLYGQGSDTDILNSVTDLTNAFHFSTRGSGSSTVVYINPQLAFDHIDISHVSGYTLTGTSVLNRSEMDARYIRVDFFNRLFQAYSNEAHADNQKVNPNDTTTTINNLKILVGTWTDQYLSAKGINPQQSGGGGSATLAGLDDVELTNPMAGQTLVYRNYHWVNENITSGTVTGIMLGTTLYSPNNGVVTLPAYPTKSSWDYDDRYYISNGVIHLGSNTITPLTSFTETDPTVPLWAKASTKPSYTWDEITSKPTTFTPPTASSSVLGGVKIGTTMEISSGVIDQKSGIVTAGTYKSLTVDTYGRVTAGTNPTTLSGYGITDAVKDNTTWWGRAINKSTTPNSVSGDITVGDGSIYLNKGRSIYVKDSVNDRVLMRLGTDNILIIGSGSAEAGYNTNLYGNVINLKYGSSTQLGMTLDNNGNVGIGTAAPSVKLDVNGDIKTATGDGAYVQIGNIRIGYDLNNTALEVYRVDNEGNHISANLYARGAVSALGSENSSGSVFDETRMWESLGSNTGTYGSTKINNSHLNLFGLSITTQNGTVTYNPATGSQTIDLSNMTGNYLPLTGGTLTLSSIDSLVIKKTDNQYGFIKFVGKVDNIADTVMGWLGINGVDNPVFRNTAGNVYKLWHEGNNGHGGGIDADKLDGQHGSYYATASSVTTLEGYFTNGVANQAVNLNVREMAVGDDYDTLSVYTSARGSFVAVNFDCGPGDVVLDDFGSYSVLASFGYEKRTIQLKGSAYDSALKYRYVTQSSQGVYNFSSWKTIAFTDSDITGNADTATKLSDESDFTAWGATFFTGGTPTSISNAPLSGVTNIDSLLHFDTANSRVGIGIGVSSPSSELDVNGKVTINNESGYAIEAWGQLRFNASKELKQNGDLAHPQRIVFGCLNDNYQPFIRFKGSDGTIREVLNYNPSNELLLGDNTKATYVRGANINIYSKATDSQSLVMAIKCYSGGRVGIGDITTSYLSTVPSSYTGSKLIVRGDEYVDGSLAIGSKIYLYRDSSNSSNDIYFEKVTENGVNFVKLNGNFYATGAVSALGSNSSSGGTVDMDTVWTALAANDTSHKIDNSHLTLGTLTINGTTYNPTNTYGVTMTLATDRLGQYTIQGLDSLSSFIHETDLIYMAAGGNNNIGDKPDNVTAFGVLSYKVADGYYGQILHGANGRLYYRQSTNLSGGWNTVVISSDLDNYLLSSDISAWAKASTKPTYTWEEITSKPSIFTPPVASSSVRGGIKVGDTLAISNEVLNLAAVTVGAPATTDIKFTKVVVDSYGRVTKATTLEASDIPDLSWNKITSDKPTTLSGYGITDAVKDNTTWWGQTINKTTTPNSVSGDITVGDGSIYLNKGRSIYVKDSVNDRVLMRLGTNNVLIIGSGAAEAGYNTYYYGKNLYFKYGTATVTGMILNDNGNVGIGTTTPAVKLHVNGDSYTSGKIYLYKDASNSDNDLYFERDGSSVKLHGNFYATGAVSALGANSSSGGGGVGDVTWEALATTATGGRTIDSSYISGFLSDNGGIVSGDVSVIGYLDADRVYAQECAKLGNICVECSPNGSFNNGDYVHEINNFSSALNLNYSTTNPVTVCQGKIVFKHQNGWSYIETNDPNDDDLEIHVNQLYVRTEDGFFGNNSYNLSDIRLKDITDYPSAPLEMIANAPIFNFRWKDGRNKHEHLGTSAQYWEDRFAKATRTMANGYLAMDYGAVALASAVITARKVLEHEGRIRLLEIENQALRKEIEQLKKVA